MNRQAHVRLIERLKPLGIEIELGGNFPWIYLRAVNGIIVKEKFAANHGFTAFWYPTKHGDEVIKFSDRRKVFEKIREMVSGEEPDYHYEDQNV